MRIPLLGGAYATRSIIAECQRCVNLFPEVNPKTAASPVTFYQRPGLRPLATAANNAAPVRGLYRASNGNGYCVVGQIVYSIGNDWSLTILGMLITNGTGPVSMIDNGIELMLVDSTQQGYTIDLVTNDFAQLIDASFNGAVAVDTIDTFTIWNVPQTQQFQSSLSNQIIPLDPTYFASKSAYPDFLQRLIVNRNEILLIGELKGEIWYDAGGSQFPFARLPGAYIEHGTVAPFSVAASDFSVFWLSQDLQGVGYVIRQRGYDTKVISNFALSFAIRQMAAKGTIADAIGYTYTQDGHAFYVLTFPSGDQTWVFDDSLGGDPMYAWHQRSWLGAGGMLHRDRTNCHAFINGTNVVGDWQNGTLYAMDLNVYQDTVAGVTQTISCIRTFSHIFQGQGGQGQLVDADGKRVQFESFLADIESGAGSGGPFPNPDGTTSPDQLWLRWSNDRGKSWGQSVFQSNGAPGEYLTQPKWGNLGIARDRVFELGYTINGPAALNGAWLTDQVLNT